MGRGEVCFGFGAAVVVMGVAGIVGSRLVGRRTVLGIKTKTTSTI